MADPTDKSLEARVRELEDIREINEVFYKWHDDFTGFNGLQAGRLQALECLTDDATIEIEGIHPPGQGPRAAPRSSSSAASTKATPARCPTCSRSPWPRRSRSTAIPRCSTPCSLACSGSALRTRPPASEGEAGTIGLYRRTNNFVRTPSGWKISKTTQQGGLTAPLPTLLGNLNQLPEPEARTPWSYRGGRSQG